MTPPAATGTPHPWGDGTYSTRRHGTTLATCDSEPVQTPGCIQARGALLVLRMTDLRNLQALTAHQPSLLDAIDAGGAGGAALHHMGRWWCVGRVPDPARLDDPAAWLYSQPAFDPPARPVSATDAWASVCPAAVGLEDIASGVLAAALSCQRRGLLVWFRPQTMQTVTWAGNPHDAPPAPGPHGRRLTVRTDSLLDSLLHFSRVGRMDLELEQADLNAVLEAALEMIGARRPDSRCRIALPRPLPRVLCDPVRLREINSNLLANAIKHTQQAEAGIEVGSLAGDEAGARSNAPADSAGLAHPILRASSGGQGLRLLRGAARGRALPVLLDLNTPGDDGREALRDIRSDDSLRTLPLVVQSASANPRDLQFCSAQGANACHVQPVDHAQHLQVLQSVFA